VPVDHRQACAPEHAALVPALSAVPALAVAALTTPAGAGASAAQVLSPPGAVRLVVKNMLDTRGERSCVVG
jgi:hypothetical protein